jgi:hypothetical protein
MLYGADGASSFCAEVLGTRAAPLFIYASTEDLFDGAREGKEIYYATSLLGSEKRMISNRSKSKSKALYSPYDVWSSKVSPVVQEPRGGVLEPNRAVVDEVWNIQYYNTPGNDVEIASGLESIVTLNRSDFEGEF